MGVWTHRFPGAIVIAARRRARGDAQRGASRTCHTSGLDATLLVLGVQRHGNRCASGSTNLPALRGSPMTTAKRIKQAILRSCHRSGVTRRVADSRWRQRRLLVLCYHGVSLEDEHEWEPSLYMSREGFRERLDVLRTGGYRVLSLADALVRLRERRLPPKAVALTFDDGHHDFYVHAFPLLQEFGYPATVYLTTYHARDQRPVFDMVSSYLLWKSRATELDATDILDGPRSLSLRTDAERDAVAWRLYRRVRALHLTDDEKDQMARLLAQRLNVDYDHILRTRLLHLMSPEEVAAVARGAVSVQLHTHRHWVPRNRQLFLREIEDNRREISAMVQHAPPLVHFCYPSGDTDRAFLPWLKDAGIVSAVTCRPGLARPHTNPFLIPRVLDSATLGRLEFEGWLSGVTSYLRRRRR